MQSNWIGFGTIVLLDLELLQILEGGPPIQPLPLQTSNKACRMNNVELSAQSD
jgi:hypothetical protein